MVKLQGAAAARVCERPDPALSGYLLYGPDAAFTADRRRALASALQASGSFVPSRLEAADARRDPAALYDTLRAVGFFADRPLVLLTGAGDGLAPTVQAAVEGLAPEDGVLVVEAGALTPRSALRALFEKRKHLAAVALFPDPMDPAEIAGALSAAGLAAGIAPDALDLLAAHARESDRGSFARLLDVVTIAGADRSAPLDAETVAALLPATAETETAALALAVMSGRPDRAVRLLGRLAATGVAPSTLAIQLGAVFATALRHAVKPGGALKALTAARFPPAMRSVYDTAARRWTAAGLEDAVMTLQACERTMRSSGPALADRPDRAMLERAILRLAMVAAR
ncbi:MAG: hypothetical protein AAF677_00315 [Pseudomonadota bacterium]